MFVQCNEISQGVVDEMRMIFTLQFEIVNMFQERFACTSELYVYVVHHVVDENKSIKTLQCIKFEV